MMVECVERRFAALSAPHRIQWLSDNGSLFAAGKTIEIAPALNLEPCFTPVESPESNGNGRSFRQSLQARLCQGQPYPRRPHGASGDRFLDGGLQHDPPAFPAGLSLSSGIHYRSIATRRVSGLTGSTPASGRCRSTAKTGNSAGANPKRWTKARRRDVMPTGMNHRIIATTWTSADLLILPGASPIRTEAAIGPATRMDIRCHNSARFFQKPLLCRRRWERRRKSFRE